MNPNDLFLIDWSPIASSVLGQVSVREIDLARDWKFIEAIHNSCRERDKIDPYSVCYKVPNIGFDTYTQLLDEAPEDTSIILFVGDEPVAHGWMESWGYDEIAYLWRVWVSPSFRNLGIGTTLMRWGELRATTLHQQVNKPAQHLANSTMDEVDAVRLIENEGYSLNFISPELGFDDWDRLEELAPRGANQISIRPIQESEARQVVECLAEANANPDDLASPDETDRAMQNLQPFFADQCNRADLRLSRAGWLGDRMVGVILAAMNDGVGDLPQVAVRHEARRRGIARSLAGATLSALRDAGCQTVRLFTSVGPDESLPPDGPYAMYLKFGFKMLSRHLRYRKRLHR